MSCLDCGQQFTAITIKPHTSCISEKDKYAARSNTNTQSYCADCQLPLQGAVASLQHYESKKHKATLRRKKAEQKALVPRKPTESHLEQGKSAASPKLKETLEASPSPGKDVSSVGEVIALEESATSAREQKRALRKAMSRIIKRSRSKKVKISKLIVQVQNLLGTDAPGDLEARIKSRSSRSPFSMSSKGRVAMLSD